MFAVCICSAWLLECQIAAYCGIWCLLILRCSPYWVTLELGSKLCFEAAELQRIHGLQRSAHSVCTHVAYWLSNMRTLRLHASSYVCETCSVHLSLQGQPGRQGFSQGVNCCTTACSSADSTLMVALHRESHFWGWAQRAYSWV